MTLPYKKTLRRRELLLYLIMVFSVTSIFAQDFKVINYFVGRRGWSIQGNPIVNIRTSTGNNISPVNVNNNPLQGTLLRSPDGRSEVVVDQASNMITLKGQTHPHIIDFYNGIGAGLNQTTPIFANARSQGVVIEGSIDDGNGGVFDLKQKPLAFQQVGNTGTISTLDVRITNPITYAGSLRNEGFTFEILSTRDSNVNLAGNGALILPGPAIRLANFNLQASSFLGEQVKGNISNIFLAVFDVAATPPPAKAFAASKLVITTLANSTSTYNSAGEVLVRSNNLLNNLRGNSWVGISTARSLAKIRFNSTTVEGTVGRKIFGNTTSSVRVDTEGIRDSFSEFEIRKVLPSGNAGDIEFQSSLDFSILSACNGCIVGEASSNFYGTEASESAAPQGELVDFIDDVNAGDARGYYGLPVSVNNRGEYKIANGPRLNALSTVINLATYKGELDESFGTVYRRFNPSSSSDESFRITRNYLQGNDLLQNFLNSSDPNKVFGAFGDGNIGLRTISFNNIFPTIIEYGPALSTSVNFNLSPPGSFGNFDDIFDDPFFDKRKAPDGKEHHLLLKRDFEKNITAITGLQFTLDHLPGGSKEHEFFGILGNDKEERSLLRKIFRQSVAIPNEMKTVSDSVKLNKSQPETAFANTDVYTYMEIANQRIKEILYRYLERETNEKTQGINKDWLSYLKQVDEVMLDRILCKITSYSKSNEASSLSITPKLGFGLSITPRITFRNNKEGRPYFSLKDLGFDVKLALKNATISLASDENCDLQGETGVHLTREEQSFILKAWSEDLDGDGIPDKGFIRSINRRKKAIETMIPPILRLVDNPEINAYRKVLLLSIGSEFYKTFKDQEPGTQKYYLTNSMNLKLKNLEADYPLRGQVIKRKQKEDVKAAIDCESGVMVYKASEIYIGSSINPLQVVHPVKEEDKIAQKANSPYEVKRLQFSSIFGRSVENNSTSIALSSAYDLETIIRNKTGSTKRNVTIEILLKTDSDPGVTNLAKWKVNPWGPKQSKANIFVFKPITTGWHTLRVLVDRKIIRSKRFLVTKKLSSLIKKDGLCELSRSMGRNLGDETAYLGGGMVNANKRVGSKGTLNLRAKRRIVLSPGFRSVTGSRTVARIENSCKEISDRMFNEIKANYDF